MLAGLTPLVVSLALAVLLPFLTATQGHDATGDTETYRYSIRLERLFLAAIVVAGGALAAACTVVEPARRLPGWVLPAAGLLAIGFIGIFQRYVSSYRVRIDAAVIRVSSAFGSRSVELAAIAAIGVARGRGVDLTLYGRDERCLATIGGSIQDFDSLLATLERRTRSPDVMLYRATGFDIEEKPNDPRSAWRPSRGPAASRRRGWAGLAIIVAVVVLVIGWALYSF